jgi:hypothetical protein
MKPVVRIHDIDAAQYAELAPVLRRQPGGLGMRPMRLRVSIYIMTPIQEAVWNKMLTVELNALYYGKKAFWLGLRLNWLRFLAALIATAAFGSLFSHWEIFRAIATFLAAAAALYLSYFNLQHSLFEVEAARVRYGLIYGQLEQLWNDICVGLSEEEIAARFDPLVDAISQIKEPTLGVSKRLTWQSYSEVCATHGLA